MDILYAEGLTYLDNMLENAGVIKSSHETKDYYAIHTHLKWNDCKRDILDKVNYRELITDFERLKTTKLKDGRFNYVFKIKY